MDLDDLKGLKYYAIYCAVLIMFFIYSGMTGWKWLIPPKQNQPVLRLPGQGTYIDIINNFYHGI